MCTEAHAVRIYGKTHGKFASSEFGILKFESFLLLWLWRYPVFKETKAIFFFWIWFKFVICFGCWVLLFTDLRVFLRLSCFRYDINSVLFTSKANNSN